MTDFVIEAGKSVEGHFRMGRLGRGLEPASSMLMFGGGTCCILHVDQGPDSSGKIRHEKLLLAFLAALWSPKRLLRSITLLLA